MRSPCPHWLLCALAAVGVMVVAALVQGPGAAPVPALSLSTHWPALAGEPVVLTAAVVIGPLFLWQAQALVRSIAGLCRRQ